MGNELDGKGEMIPEFSLMVFDNGENVDIAIHTPRQPDISKHASLGMLYGLALLTLERQGYVQHVVDHYMQQGTMSEIDCMNAITLIMDKTGNDIPS